MIETRLTQATEEKKTITIDGNETRVGLPPKVADQIKAGIPLGRAGTAQEAADGVYLFCTCTDESNYISGQVILVGGGLTA